MIKVISAELLKLKGTYTYLLPLAIVGFSCAIAGLALVLDAHFSIRLGEGPWDRLDHGGLVIYLMMLYNPFIILLVSAVYYVEQQANSWKLLFVQPVTRSIQYFSKIFLLLLFMLGTSLLMLGSLVLTGYLVDLWVPEFGFAYFTPEWTKVSGILFHSLICGLGVLGIQNLLSYWFSNILVALGVGILGFILAIILAATGSSFALYLPYSYVLIVPELETFPFEYQTFPIPGVSNLELLSIAWFIFSIGLGYFYTKTRDVY